MKSLPRNVFVLSTYQAKRYFGENYAKINLSNARS